ncbi:MAG: HEAT repeat domain-containing protein [Candidatus Thorarchaeota archaeon]
MDLSVPEMVERRRYRELERVADEYARRGDWSLLVSEVQRCSPEGKSRDALVFLLELESVGGTDTDIFKEFSILKGDTLDEIRAEAHGVAIGLLREQIASRHTYFLDVQAMAATRFAILIDDVIETRRKEIQALPSQVSRLEVLATYYGFVILTTDGAIPQKMDPGRDRWYWKHRTWLDEDIGTDALAAIREMTEELANPVDMTTRYQTLGDMRIFKKRCSADTARILADTIRLSLYKRPGNRIMAARSLGHMGDSRALRCLHSRLLADPSRRVQTEMACAIGNIGHECSVEVMRQYIQSIKAQYYRPLSQAVNALGRIDADTTRAVLIDLTETGSSSVKAAAIMSLSRLGSPNLLAIASSHIKSTSKVVTRAATFALLRLGTEGQEVVKMNAAIVLKRLIHDHPSRDILNEVFDIDGILDGPSFQETLSKEVDELTQMILRARREQEQTSSTWLREWSRYEDKMKDQMKDLLKMISRVKPPYGEFLEVRIQQARKVLNPH